MTIDECIDYAEKQSEWMSKYAMIDIYKDRSEYYRQLAEWLRELKAYKELSTYNRPNKCNKCEYEDSEYFCDDCIWSFVNKFKPREVNADDE